MTQVDREAAFVFHEQLNEPLQRVRVANVDRSYVIGVNHLPIIRAGRHFAIWIKLLSLGG
jgi:hypothetical protein